MNTAQNSKVDGTKLRKARLGRGWTVEEVAKKIHVVPKTYSRWENGKTMPHPSAKQNLCILFEMSASDLGFSSNVQIEQKQHLGKWPMWKIPATHTTLIGREQDVSDVCKFLKDEKIRLVTLVGTGGIGKTRLAIEVAEHMSDSFIDGACLIALGDIKDPALVMSSIAEGLDIPENVAVPLDKSIKTALQNKFFLLILDSIEQIDLTESVVVSIVDELLSACLSMKIMITSRSMLNLLSGEQKFPVKPLKLPDLKHFTPLEKLRDLPSITLFVDRAQKVKPDFSISDINARDIAKCCVRLGGLPLAIELAAARMDTFSPKTLFTYLSNARTDIFSPETPFTYLSEGLTLLKNENPTLPKRQRSLYNAIKWSYDQLDEQEQWLFRQLSVFRGKCSLETAQQVLKRRLSNTSITTGITSLFNKSLLQRTDGENKEEVYFVMLEMVREFGLDCLREKGEFVESAQAHARYYLDYVEYAASYLKGVDQGIYLARLEENKENLRAALAWLIEKEAKEVDAILRFCEAYGKFCGLSGYWSEEMRWLTIALAQPYSSSTMSTSSKCIRSLVLRRAGHLAYRFRNLAKAKIWQVESVQLAEAAGDKENLVGALSGLARTVIRTKDTTYSALSMFQESVSIARKFLDESTNALQNPSRGQWCLANALESLGHFVHSQGDLEQAYQLLTESIDLIRMVGDKESLTRLSLTLVSIELSRGKIAHAVTIVQECSGIAQELGMSPLKALVLESLGTVAVFQGDYEQAMQLITNRLDIARELGDASAVAKSQLLLGDIHLALHDPERAHESVLKSLQFFRNNGGSSDRASALNTLGTIKLEQKESEESWELYKEALRIEKVGGEKINIGKHLIGLALVKCHQGYFKDAALFLGAALHWINPDIDLHPIQRKRYDQAMQQTLDSLGDRNFEDLRSRGCKMDLEEIITA